MLQGEGLEAFVRLPNCGGILAIVGIVRHNNQHFSFSLGRGEVKKEQTLCTLLKMLTSMNDPFLRFDIQSTNSMCTKMFGFFIHSPTNFTCVHRLYL